MYDNRMYGEQPAPTGMFPNSQAEGFPPQPGYPAPQQRNFNASQSAMPPQLQGNGPVQSPMSGLPPSQFGGGPPQQFPGASPQYGAPPGSAPPQFGGMPPSQPPRSSPSQVGAPPPFSGSATASSGGLPPPSQPGGFAQPPSSRPPSQFGAPTNPLMSNQPPMNGPPSQPSGFPQPQVGGPPRPMNGPPSMNLGVSTPTMKPPQQGLNPGTTPIQSDGMNQSPMLPPTQATGTPLPPAQSGVPGGFPSSKTPSQFTGPAQSEGFTPPQFGVTPQPRGIPSSQPGPPEVSPPSGSFPPQPVTTPTSQPMGGVFPMPQAGPPRPGGLSAAEPPKPLDSPFQAVGKIPPQNGEVSPRPLGSQFQPVNSPNPQGNYPPMQSRPPSMPNQSNLAPSMNGQSKFNAPPSLSQNYSPQANGFSQSLQNGLPSPQDSMKPSPMSGPPMRPPPPASTFGGPQPPNAGPPLRGPPPPNAGPLPRGPQPGGLAKPYPTSQVDGYPGSPAGGMPRMPSRVPQYGEQYYGQQQQFASSPNIPPQPQPPSYPQPGGYPSPNYPQSGGYPSQPSQPHYPAQPQEPQRKLDPDQMPSPIQVITDDQRAKSGKFYTNQKGLVPPLVTTDFIVQDQGNASARFIRSTMYNVPITQDIMKQASVPFGIVLSPLAQIKPGENDPPIVDMGELGPVRCNRCKAYMSPFMQFIDGGRRFHCMLCKATTDVPEQYFQHLDHTGQRVDRYERPELVLGAYEFVATKEYCTNNTFPKPPAMIFLIDVSYNNIKSGMVHLICSQMRSILLNLPKEPGQSKSSVRVGFITYNNTVHFYNIKACLGQPQMMVVGDVADMFMPLLDGFLCDPEESEQVILSLMEQIPSMFADTRETETILAPAITAGLEALKAAECAGKLLVFHSSLPIAEAPGKLKNRDDRKLLGTDKEKSVLSPQNQVYNNLGQDCVGAGCSVDLFIFNNSFIDLATIGQVSRLTGGQVYKYTYFQADVDGERLIMDICENISRPIAFNAIMRVRTSTGVRPTDFYGHFYMANTTDMEFGSIDCNKAVAVEIKHDDKLTEEDGVYIQVALLYTSCSAQRRVRVLNLALNTCSQMADLFRACELDTIINFFSKQAVFKLLEATPKAVKESLINRCAQILACYRKNCALPSSAGQLILPECMKLLPLYINCVLKSDAVSGGSDLTIDDRWFAMDSVMISDIPSSVVYFYPRLIPLVDIDVTSLDIPVPIRCSIEKMNNEGAFILENGIHMFLWVGLNVSNDWVMNVFGVSSVMQIDTDKASLPYLENPLSARIRELIKSIRSQRNRAMRLTLVRPRDKMEIVMKHFLVEDRGVDGSSSYVDFLCFMHKEIRNLLS